MVNVVPGTGISPRAAHIHRRQAAASCTSGAAIGCRDGTECQPPQIHWCRVGIGAVDVHRPSEPVIHHTATAIAAGSGGYCRQGVFSLIAPGTDLTPLTPRVLITHALKIN